MAQSAVGRAPEVLATFGLGSCVGIALWDPRVKIGALGHVMLPDSTQARVADNRDKFADTSVPDLVKAVEKLGASRRRLIVKIAGGAQMFNLFGDDRFSIGRRNVEAVKASLEKLNLVVAGEDTGGTYGRTMFFDTEGGIVTIRTIDHGQKTI